MVLIFLGLLLLSGCNGGPNYASTAVPSYAQIQSTILTPKCVVCHSDENPIGGVSFESYQSTITAPGAVTPYQPTSSNLYNITLSGQMPRNAAPLSSTEMGLLYTWISLGAKNN